MIGKDLKYMRFRRSMTQEYVANTIGISRFALSGYESGRTCVPLTVAIKLNKLYDLDEAEVDRYIMK